VDARCLRKVVTLRAFVRDRISVTGRAKWKGSEGYTRSGGLTCPLSTRRAIECKVFNSSINSIKRLLGDAAAKAEAWLRDFGTLQVVPTAVLSGVYKRAHLEQAQRRGLTLYWAHRLHDLVDWIERCRTP
jgi:hypothetical protein